MTFGKVTHCIFDLDGTIFDTEKVYYKSIDGVLRQFGKQHSMELCRKVIGRTRQDYSKIIVDYAKLPITPQEFLERMDVISHSMFLNSVLLPGARELILHLHKHGIPCAVGTSSNLASVDLKFTHHKDLEACFNHVVSGTDDPAVLKGKPAPDVFLVAAQRFNPAPDPATCLVFEDAPNGVRAGLSAGMQVVMIPDPKVVTDEQRREPTVCLNSLEDFKPELFGLPAFVAPAPKQPINIIEPSIFLSDKLVSEETLEMESEA